MNTPLSSLSPFEAREIIQQELDIHGDVFAIPDNPYVVWSIRYMLQKGHWNNEYLPYILREHDLLWDFWSVIPKEAFATLELSKLEHTRDHSMLFLKKKMPELFGNLDAVDDLWQKFYPLLNEITNKSIDFIDDISQERTKDFQYTQQWKEMLNHPLFPSLLSHPIYHKKIAEKLYLWLYRDYRSRDIKLVSNRRVPFLQGLMALNNDLWVKMRQGYCPAWNLLQILPEGATPEQFPFDSSCKILSQALEDVGVVSLDLFERFEKAFLTLKNAKSRLLIDQREKEGMSFPWLVLAKSSKKTIQKWLEKNQILESIDFYHPFSYVASDYPEAQRDYLVNNQIGVERHAENIENAKKVMGSHYDAFAKKIKEYYDPLLIMNLFDEDFTEKSKAVMKYNYDDFIALANKQRYEMGCSSEVEIVL